LLIHRDDRLRRLPQCLLHVAREQEVERLVGPPQLDVGLHGDGVIALEDGVQQLERGDWAALLHPAGKVVALEKARDREPSQQAEQLVGAHVQPLAVAPHLGAPRVEDLERLVLKRRRVLLDLLRGQQRALRSLAARVPDAGGEVPDDQDDGMTCILEGAQLVEHHHVAEMDIGRSRIDPELHAQRAPLLELLLERSAREDLDRAGREIALLEPRIRHRANARLTARARRGRDARGFRLDAWVLGPSATECQPIVRRPTGYATSLASHLRTRRWQHGVRRSPGTS
jgi:hypothetical protein